MLAEIGACILQYLRFSALLAARTLAVRALGSVSGSVSDCVPCRWKRSFFGWLEAGNWQRSSWQAPAMHVTRASGKIHSLRLPTATSLDWELHHPVNVSQAIRLPAFAQL